MNPIVWVLIAPFALILGVCGLAFALVVILAAKDRKHRSGKDGEDHQ